MTKSLPDLDNLIVSFGMMQNTARGCLKTMEILLDEKNQEYTTSWHVPFYILASTALELFAKMAIIKNKEKSNNFSEIIVELKKFDHKLDLLYSADAVGLDFLQKADISKVLKNNIDQFVFRYDFYRKPGSIPIQVYDLESLRYGFLSGNKSNAAFVAYQFNDLLEVCKQIENATINIKNNIKNLAFSGKYIKKTEKEWQYSSDNFFLKFTSRWFEFMQWLIVLGILEPFAKKSPLISLIYLLSFLSFFYFLLAKLYKIPFYKALPANLIHTERTGQLISIIIAALISIIIYFYLPHIVSILSTNT